MSDVLTLMGQAARATAECSVAMGIANKCAGRAAEAFEAAAKAQEELGLSASAYWANAAVFRGIEKNGKDLNLEGLASMFMEFADICVDK